MEMSEPLRVLIVEDTPSDADLIVRELRRTGFAPEWVRVDTEPEYLDRLHSGLDIILSDYQMPQFSGPRALEILKKVGLEVPFIILSGAIGEDLAVEAMKQGASDYLLKDRLARLGPAVRLALAQSRMGKMRAITESALRQSEERLKLALSSSHMGVWEWDAKANSVFCSPECCEIFGEHSLSGDYNVLFKYLPEEDAARVKSAFLEALTSQTDHSAEFRIVRPDGVVRWISNQGRATYGKDGRPARMIGTTQDITDRKQLEEQYRQSQKMEAIGQLASGVAHDFNNLLTVIQGNASMLTMREVDQAELHDHVEQIIQASERAAGLTRQLLLFSRKQIMQPTNLDLNEVTGNMTRMLQRIVGEDIALQADYAQGLPPIHADPGMIEQILLNLAVNSRDAMPIGGQLTISTSTEVLDETQAKQHRETAPGTYACLSVSDTGCGIPPEILPRIFEPFFTTKEVGKGTGLGLATVYGIVRQHRGSISIESVPGQGTTFRIYFPETRSSAPKAVAPSGGTLFDGTETILLVEDEPALKMIVARVLAQCGYTVLTAISGVKALEVWREHREKIHLLMTDMVMPGGVSGRELATRLTTDKPGLKVIYTSGYSAELAGKGLALHEGVNFLQKPWGMKRLKRTVREALDRV